MQQDNQHRLVRRARPPRRLYPSLPTGQEPSRLSLLKSHSESSAHRSSSGSFRVPSPTSSDEEAISREEQTLEEAASALSTKLAQFDLSSESPQTGSEHLSRLGEDSSLFEHVKDSPPPFIFNSKPPPKMVVEREPPKPSPQKPLATSSQTGQPVEFGRPSFPQNRMQPNAVFNVPKPNQPRPEHHRPPPPPHVAQNPARPYQTAAAAQNYPNQYPNPDPNSYQNLSQQPVFRNPLQPRPASNDPDVVEIPRPANAATWNYQRNAPPLFSAYQPPVGRFAPINQLSSNHIDLTKTDGFDPDPALRDDRFGAADPYLYVDAEKAAENIKALLEGTFDDEDEKPRTRGKTKKAAKSADELTDKLKSLAVNGDENKENAGGPLESHQEEDEDDEDGDDGTVEGLEVKLLPHQVEGVEWMREKEIGTKKKNGVLPKGGILADDMGLGKTIQSLALILTNPRPPITSSITEKKALSSKVGRNTLVVAPLALIKQWEAEISDKVSDSHKLRVCVHHGPQRTKRFEDLKRYDVVITTYQILVSEHSGSSPREDGPQVGCFGVHWYRVILDEAHTVKNRNAKATQACYALRTEYRWCLTGTPMQNNLDELQSLIRFLQIKPYDDLAIWRDQITRPMNNGRGGIAIKRLQYYLKAFMKRRTKDILKEDGALNPGGKKNSKDGPNAGFKIVERKIESISTEFSPKERAFYDRLEQRAGKNLDEMMETEGMNYASALVLLLRLRQACNHPKLLKGALTNDRDALSTGQNGSQSPNKPHVVDKDVDDMADLLGGLSVEVKKCDICQKRLSKEETAGGLNNCNECADDLETQHKKSKKQHKNRSADQKVKPEKQKSSAHAKRILSEDSDEEGDGDWLVPDDERQVGGLGKAGGTDDENAEGAGESLGSSDSDSDEESHDSKQRPSNFVREISDSEHPSSDSDIPPSFQSKVKRTYPSLSAKIRQLLKILHRESATHKFIVYSQFTSMLDLIEPFLRRDHLTYTRYDGSMRNDAREQSLAQLRSSSQTSPRILLCSLKCGSLGLNLTAASRVVILEPFWNPFVEEQAIDRVHRINQTVDVVVYKLTVAETVEARILDLQERKRELARQAIENGGSASGRGKGKKGKEETAKLSMRDILRLFGREAEYRDNDHGHVVAKPGGVLNRGAGTTAEGQERGERKPTQPKRTGGEDPIYGRRW